MLSLRRSVYIFLATDFRSQLLTPSGIHTLVVVEINGTYIVEERKGTLPAPGARKKEKKNTKRTVVTSDAENWTERRVAEERRGGAARGGTSSRKNGVAEHRGGTSWRNDPEPRHRRPADRHHAQAGLRSAPPPDDPARPSPDRDATPSDAHLVIGVLFLHNVDDQPPIVAVARQYIDEPEIGYCFDHYLHSRLHHEQYRVGIVRQGRRLSH